VAPQDFILSRQFCRDRFFIFITFNIKRGNIDVIYKAMAQSRLKQAPIKTKIKK